LGHRLYTGNDRENGSWSPLGERNYQQTCFIVIGGNGTM
jgi:hypothetical protein